MGGTFKLLRGKHAEGKDENGKQIIYKMGSTFVSNTDLDKLHNKQNSTKFERISDKKLKITPKKHKVTLPDETPDDELDTLTQSELMEYAETEEIDVSNARTKSDMVRVIRENI
jgi:hypothetical protein